MTRIDLYSYPLQIQGVTNYGVCWWMRSDISKLRPDNVRKRVPFIWGIIGHTVMTVSEGFGEVIWGNDLMKTQSESDRFWL